jgi:hypothetical protein
LATSDRLRQAERNTNDGYYIDNNYYRIINIQQNMLCFLAVRELGRAGFNVLSLGQLVQVFGNSIITTN